jgi:two-component system sensor histidine kinase KdpD
LNENVRFAEGLGATVEKLTGKSVAKAVADYVREKRITEVIFGRSAVKGWKRFLYLTAVQKFLREAPPVDVHIVTQEEH